MKLPTLIWFHDAPPSTEYAAWTISVWPGASDGSFRVQIAASFCESFGLTAIDGVLSLLVSVG